MAPRGIANGTFIFLSPDILRAYLERSSWWSPSGVSAPRAKRKQQMHMLRGASMACTIVVGGHILVAPMPTQAHYSKLGSCTPGVSTLEASATGSHMGFGQRWASHVLYNACLDILPGERVQGEINRSLTVYIHKDLNLSVPRTPSAQQSRLWTVTCSDSCHKVVANALNMTLALLTMDAVHSERGWAA